MKIAFFTDSYEPQINGVVTSINLFVENLRKDGHEVHIFCPSCKKKDRYTHPCVSKPLKKYPGYRVGLPTLSVLDDVIRINPDVIHVHSPFKMGLSGMAIAKILKIPVVATYHTLFPEYTEYSGFSVRRDVANDYIKFFLNRASTVIAPSESVKQLLEESKVRRRIEVLPTPLGFKVRKGKKDRRRELTILHVGRLGKEKRIDVVMKAFQKVSERTASRLIITSDGPDRKRLEGLCDKLGIKDKVTFTGFVSSERLMRLYSNAGVFVSASDTETQGLTVLEAMANGCPVIARNASGFKDVIKDGKNGFLFETEDELADDIMLINKDARIRNMIIKNGYETVKMFGAEEITKRMENIYKETVSNQRESRTASRLLYASYLILDSLESLAIKSANLPMNSKMMRLHINSLRTVLMFDKLHDRLV